MRASPSAATAAASRLSASATVAPFRLDLGAGALDLSADVGEAVLLGEPARRGGRRFGGGRKPVPTPQVSLARDEALTRLERGREKRSFGAPDEADLGEAAGELARRRHMRRQRLGALRQGRIAGVHRRAHPADGRRLIDRRIEIVAERRAQRRLVALRDVEQVDHRRPQLLRIEIEHLAQRARLGLEPMQAPLRLGKGRAHRIEPLACRRMGDFGPQRRGFRLGGRGLGRLDGGGERGQIRRTLAARLEACELGLDLGDLALQARQPLGMLGARSLELIAPRREIGELGGQFREDLLRRRELRFGRR